jgi:hypothetical protein
MNEGHIHSFRTAIAKYHRLDSLNSTVFLSQSSGAWKYKVKVFLG